MNNHEFDVIVIGAGPAGEIAAGRLATKGKKQVAIVEGHLVGESSAKSGACPAPPQHSTAAST